MQKRKHALNLTVTMVVLLTLSACGAGKKTITVDDSADYTGAITLQPLKRPSSSSVVVEPTSQPAVAVEVDEPVVSSVDISELDEGLDADSEKAASAETLAVAPIEQVRQDIADNVVSSEVIDGNNGEQRLLIDAEFDQAWSYLNNNLQTSDLTVFSRNKVAGRFAVGCGNIDAAPAVVKKSGWSFLNREKLERLEYCALDLSEKRGKTSVTVLNRSGVEVLGEYSRPIFERILSK